MHQNQNKNTKHIPVLSQEVLANLTPQSGDAYLDLTAGYGGHAELVLAQTKHQAVLVDRDQQAVDSLKQHFNGQDVSIIHSDFLAASQLLIREGQQFNLILADLGVSSPHLDNPDRGFAFSQDGPLDMRMDQRQTLTAEHIVNTFGQTELENLLRSEGEEPRAKTIVRAIVEHRPLHTTTELALVISKAVGRGSSRVHPATRTFQALRIAVNSELSMLEAALPLWFDLLAVGGRIAIISFHSLEDRIVKLAFKERAGNRYDASLRLLTKNPVMASAQELAFNPRARSAKLRAAVKINNERSVTYADNGKK
ncbi:MAG: Ribosomal small subunit methyltransferase [Candidatus Saccharibacteria bacterium]|nr:Ribosomal small subunit methyltransferase [Candidatus Saccharibacteria bacterium]